MATKDYHSSFKENAVYKNSSGEYINLNLNQNHKISNLSPLLSTNITINEKKSSNHGSIGTKSSGVEDLHKRKESYSWNNYKKDLSSNYLNIESGKQNEEKSAIKSTLSLHIAAYENSIEGKADSSETLDSVKDTILTSAGLSSECRFEFPRQQNEIDISVPEVAQFKASQKLLNPNKIQDDKEIFYSTLDENQKKMFKKIEEQQNDKIFAMQLALQDKQEECDDLTAQLAEFTDDTKQRQAPRKGPEFDQTLKNELLSAGVDLENKNQQINHINNFIYYRLLKLLTRPQQKRVKLLQLLGCSSYENDETVLSPKFLSSFDQRFLKARTKARVNKQMQNFDIEIIKFPKEQIPYPSTTVTESSRAAIDVDLSGMPSLERMDTGVPLPESTGEPIAKKVRIESEIYRPRTADAQTQTDLKLKHILVLEETKSKFKKMYQQIKYHKEQSGSLKGQNKEYEALLADHETENDVLEELYNEFAELQQKHEKLNEEIRQLHTINLQLKDEMDNPKTSRKFFLKDDKSNNFTVEAHTCFSRLISQGCVAQDKVPIVLLIVAELFKFVLDAVPSRRTVGRDIHMVHSLNCEYIAKMVNECSNLTFCSDETTKFFHKIQAMVLTGKNDKTQQYFVLWIGFGEVPDKSAERCLIEFKLLLSNIAKLGNLDVEEFIQKVVINIRNLMGDQAATTKLLYLFFIEYRAFCLANSDFDEATKARLDRVNKFFCMIHILNNSSAVVFNALLDHEKYTTNNEDATDAAVSWVLKEVPRYFAKRSSGKHSTAGQWETLRKEMELEFAKIDSNVGHRFIIRFKIAAQITHNREDIIAFLENLGNADEKLITLKNALKNDLIILHLHVLALLGALVLHPMWQLSEASESVLQMSLYAPALIKYLKELVDDPMILFTLNSPFNVFPSAAPKANQKASAFLNSLKERPIPVGGSEVVPIVAKGLLEYFKRQLDPFITGDFSSPDINLERETAGAPLTNMACESGFGYMDRLFTTKPNMTTYNRSVLTVAAKNKIFDYISKLPEEEQNAMYLRAFGNRKLSEQLSAEKTKQIHRENIERIEKLALKQQIEKQKKEAARKRMAVDLRESGFWLSVEEMEEALKDIPRSTAIKYVKSNIRFRKTNHTYTYPELVQNLKAVIAADFTYPDAEINDTSESEED